MARTLAIRVIVACLATGSAAAQPTAAERARIAGDLREYHALIAAWRGGDDTAVQRVLSWSPARVLAVVAHAETPFDPVRPWEGSRFEAAAMMHADAALTLMYPADVGGVSVQLEIGSRLLERGGPGRRAFAERWYVTLATTFLDRTWVPAAERLLKLGRQRLPNDPPVLCESGIVAELMATDPAFEPAALRQLAFKFAGPGLPLSPRAFADLLKRRDYYLASAVDWLGQAVAAGSTDPCRLHLGRVLSLQGKYAEADRELAAVSTAADDAIAYLAAMFQGASAERRGRLDEAEADYRRAIGRFARGHAAYFALSRVLLGTHRVAEAQSVLREVVDAEEYSRREPWWWYFIEPTGVLTDRLDQLRREARR